MRSTVMRKTTVMQFEEVNWRRDEKTHEQNNDRKGEWASAAQCVEELGRAHSTAQRLAR